MTAEGPLRHSEDRPNDIIEFARTLLKTAAPEDKCRLTRAAAGHWRSGRMVIGPALSVPDAPARPSRPELRPPREMPKRKAAGSVAGRVALLHALAHIELNAVDLAWDFIARFCARPFTGDLDPVAECIGDWIGVAVDEAAHFEGLAQRLGELGAAYGALPAHDGMWRSARDTADDVLARLAIVPLVLEARGLDVTPGMIAGLNRADDRRSAELLQRIHDDEITHVAVGKRWFDAACQARSLEPVAAWRALVTRHFPSGPKGPFNHRSRSAAGFSADFYDGLGAA